MPPHHERYGRCHDRPPHEMLFDKLERIEERLVRIEEKIR